MLLAVPTLPAQISMFFGLNAKTSTGSITVDPGNTAGEYLGNTNSGTYTMGGTCPNSVLTAYIWVNGVTNPAPVTYNGSAMTLIGHAPPFSTQPFDVYAFYLLNPPAGAHTLTASTAGANTIMLGSSYCGVSQGGFPDSVTTTNGTTSAGSANFNLSTTTVASGAWVVAYTGMQHQITGVAPTVLRVNDVTFALSAVLDSNAGFSSPGVNFVTFNDTSVQAYTAVVFSMAPA